MLIMSGGRSRRGGETLINDGSMQLRSICHFAACARISPEQAPPKGIPFRGVRGAFQKAMCRAQANHEFELSAVRLRTSALSRTYICIYLHYFCQNIWDGTSLKRVGFPFPQDLFICILDYLIIRALNI